MKRVIGVALALLLGATPAALAQIAGGNIYGIVQDESGALLPGATVELGGPFTRSTTTGSDGRFRFLNLPADRYTLTVSLTGFASVRQEIVVTTNQSVDLKFGLKVAGIEETVTVIGETPIVDTKKFGTATTLTKTELTDIPNSRDPWAVLRTIPGVVLDRVNIAGNESGQQSSFNAKGASAADIMWNLDGVQIDDMAAAGATPTYFDYDAFEEFAVTTGGNDVSVQTGSIGLNFVTKRGTNQWRGSLRGYLAHDKLQASNIKGTELENDPRLQLADGSFSDKADHIQQINDYGAEFGGPIIKDKLWVWGSYGKQDIRLVRTNQTPDRTVLKTWVAKANWQMAQNTQLSYFFFNGGKEKYGRDPGWGVQLPSESLWLQGNGFEDFLPFNAHGMHKFELNHVFSPNFMLNVKYTNYDTGFSLTPQGGLEGIATVDFDGGVGSGPLEEYLTLRPLKNVTDVTGSYFAEGLGGSHELKFGFGYKRAEVTTSDIYGGSSGLFGYFFEPGPEGAFAKLYRQALIKYEGDFWYGFLGDTFSKDRFTLNVGLRWDSQESNNAAADVPANGTFPELLPGIAYEGGGTGVKWNNVSPRIGMTYALGESRKTVVRANFAYYASKLDMGSTTQDNPLALSYLAYLWDDVNGDRTLQANEIRFDLGLQYFGSVDPNNPTATFSPNQIDPDYKAPTDYEVIVGVDHEIVPDLAVGAAYTWRRSNDIRGWTTRLGMTSANYTAGPLSEANGFSGQAYSPDPELIDAYAGGSLLSNRPDYHLGYSGFEATLMKRLSNKWMARVAFAWMDWKEYYDGPDAVQNPTRTDFFNGGDHWTAQTPPGASGPQVNGGQYATRSGGSGKGDLFFNAKWQLTASALYQLPAGFEVAAALFARQGFTRPVVLQLSGGSDGTLRVLGTPELDSVRYPDLWNLDLRLAKNFTLGRTKLNVAADLFNVFNANTELNRYRFATSSAFDRLDEVLSPRILRFGVRFSF